VLVNIVLAIIVDNFEKANGTRHKAKSVVYDFYTLFQDLEIKYRGHIMGDVAARKEALRVLQSAVDRVGEVDAAPAHGAPRRGSLTAQHNRASAHDARPLPTTELGDVEFTEGAFERLLDEAQRGARDGGDDEPAPEKQPSAQLWKKSKKKKPVDTHKLARTVFAKKEELGRMIIDDDDDDDDAELEDIVKEADVRTRAFEDRIDAKIAHLQASVDALVGLRGAPAAPAAKPKLPRAARKPGPRVHVTNADEVDGINRLLNVALQGNPPDRDYIAELRARRTFLVSGRPPVAARSAEEDDPPGGESGDEEDY